jgi:hypothetical protein
MDLDVLAPTRARGAALAAPLALVDPSVASGIAPLAPDAPVSRNPAEILAALMDFSGSVALAELLAGDAPDGPSHPEAVRRGTTLMHEVRARLDSLLPLALKPLSGRRAPAAPPAAELLALIRAHAGAERPSPEAARRIAAELGAPLQSALATSLRQAQAHVATLRWEIAHELRALGPRADRLERIDAALQRSIQAKLGELLDRMEHAGMLTFERACQRACADLPEAPGEEALARWLVETGWIERYRERCVRMTRALYGHLRRSLEGLLRAAIHAESS